MWLQVLYCMENFIQRLRQHIALEVFKLATVAKLLSCKHYAATCSLLLGDILGLYRDNGKENGNYRDYQRLYRGYGGC